MCGYTKGVVAPYLGKDVCAVLKHFVLVEKQDLPKYRFAAMSCVLGRVTLRDLAWALQGDPTTVTVPTASHPRSRPCSNRQQSALSTGTGAAPFARPFR